MYTGTHLRAILLTQERTEAWLARRMGVHRSLVHHVLQGRRRITPNFVERACRALNLPPEALFFVGDAMPMPIADNEREVVDVAV